MKTKTNKQKIDFLIQEVKNLMVAVNDREEDNMILSSASARYELNIMANLLHEAEIINRQDYLNIVRLFPFIEPFTRLQQINNKAIGLIESGPYCENEPPELLKTFRDIENLSSLEA